MPGCLGQIPGMGSSGPCMHNTGHGHIHPCDEASKGFKLFNACGRGLAPGFSFDKFKKVAPDLLMVLCQKAGFHGPGPGRDNPWQAYPQPSLEKAFHSKMLNFRDSGYGLVAG